MNMFGKGMTFLFLLLTFSAYEVNAATQYCILNQSALRPLLIGQSWQPEFGTLDESHSNCTAVSHPPTSRWRVQDTEVVALTHNGTFIARQSGEIVAEGLDQDNNRLVSIEGFVLPKNWEMEVDLAQRTIISVGEGKRVVVRAVDAEGQSLLDAWVFILPQNSKVLSQRGCLPLRKTHECIVTGLKPGKTERRITIGDVNKIFTVFVH